MKNIRVSDAAYELLKEKAKQSKQRDVSSLIEQIARS